MLVVPWRRRLLGAATLTALILITGSSSDKPADTRGGGETAMATTPPMTATPTAWRSASTALQGLLPGMPPPLEPHDLYAADRPNLQSLTVSASTPSRSPSKDA